MSAPESPQSVPAVRDLPTEAGGDADLDVKPPPTKAAGVEAVVNAMAMTLPTTGLLRGAKALRDLNQKDGYDCPGCAWPDPEDRSMAEFCENGAKAIAEEATKRRVTPEFFAQHSVGFLREQSDFWLGQQGRITHPVYKAPGDDHYRPISWDDAFDLIASTLNGLDDPDEAIFYTSGRTSNEAAYAYQLMIRMLGTNNLPDCSNMCHESSGAALNSTIGIGKGTVTLNDICVADLVIVAGQNPGTNHPRMLSALEKQKRAGGRIVTVNPLPEAGLATFKNPQNVRGVIGKGTALTDDYLQIRLRGDQAFFAGLCAILLERSTSDPTVLDTAFIEASTTGFADLETALSQLDWADVEESTGLTRADLERVADDVVAAKSVIVCWAMGLTQHKDSVLAIKQIVNLLLMTGNIGKPGAGACPVRGHSNVQGDRTMGIWERPKGSFLDALGEEFGFEPPREHGYDVVDAIRAMRDGKARVFMAMGGNFVRATSDTAVTEQALQNMDLTVHVSTKVNGSHAVPGKASLILPTLVRSEEDQRSGRPQRVTVEDSMGMVHASTGRLTPASEHLMSETAMVCEIGARLTQRGTVDWRRMRDDYRAVRHHISRTVPGFADYEHRIGVPGGFALPNPPRDSRTFDLPDNRAVFTPPELEVLRVPDGCLILQTIRSHDQFNTTIYGMNDRYRGISEGRRVVFINPADIAALGLAAGQLVDMSSEWTDDDGQVTVRRAEAFRVVPYSTARQCAAAYFPETNVLVPLDSVAKTSNTPTSKSVIVRVEPSNVTGDMPVR